MWVHVFMCVARDSLCLFLSFLFLFHIRFLSIILPVKNVNFFTCYVNFSTCYYKTDRVRITTFTWVIINSLLVFWAPGSLLPDRVDFYGGVPSGGATEQVSTSSYLAQRCMHAMRRSFKSVCQSVPRRTEWVESRHFLCQKSIAKSEPQKLQAGTRNAEQRYQDQLVGNAPRKRSK